MKAEKNITWKSVCPTHISSACNTGGWEVKLIDGKPDFSNSSSRIPTDAKQSILNIIKAYKRLIKSANNIGTFEQIAGAYTGNLNSKAKKYYKLCSAVKYDDLVKIGEGAEYTITDYVDGSYTVAIKQQ